MTTATTAKKPSPILRVENLHKYFPVLKGVFRREVGRNLAVNNVSFKVYPQETVGVVGESGCGKSTLAKTIMRLYEPSQGRVELLGKDLATVRPRELRDMRRDIQMIFQDPLNSLNPRMTIYDVLSEPYKIQGIKMSYQETAQTIKALLAQVGLPDVSLTRYPHEFSGGQCQRIGIARALALRPKLLVCDEPVSALDVSVQSQVVNLLLTLQQELGLAYIFISHDLTVVRHISDKVLVMYLGEVVEFTDSHSLYTHPIHPYTKALLAAIPSVERRELRRHIIKGEIPSTMAPPPGCKFHTRCPFAKDKCRHEKPKLRKIDISDVIKKIGKHDPSAPHLAACHFAEELAVADVKAVEQDT